MLLTDIAHKIVLCVCVCVCACEGHPSLPLMVSSISDVSSLLLFSSLPLFDSPSASVAGLASRPEHPQDMSMMQPAQSMAQPNTSMMQHVPSMMQPAPSMMQAPPPMMQQPVDMDQSPSPPPLDNDPPIEHRIPPPLHTPSLQSLLEEVSLDKTLIAKVKEQLNNSSPAQGSPNGDHFLHQVRGEGETGSDDPCVRLLYSV